VSTNVELTGGRGVRRRPRWRQSFYERSVKPVLDRGLATLILVGAAPLMLLLALAIRLDSAGPLMFRQERIGRHNRPLGIWRFRSVRVGTPLWERTLTGERFEGVWNDADVTRVGRLLLRWKLDRLPELWNVVRGDLSLVGPRPAMPYETGRYAYVDWLRVRVKPGMTCLWQVSTGAERADPMLLDRRYVDEISATTDFLILLRTVRAVLTGTAAR
jgi:lipopolysaccharide/colanic/teichoic acid biosynthesis glycosyltransferase